jgi:predicted ATPase/class 3 adenylate cyclase
MPNLPSSTVTFLFTDIEGSTRLLQQQGQHYASLLNEYRELLRSIFQIHSGQEVDTQGDSFFIAFGRAMDALAAAMAIQRALASYSWPDGVSMPTRMGVHTGEPQLQLAGYVGMDVHRAARLTAAGHGGQVLLTQATASLVRHDLPEDVGLRDLGEYRLKDLLHPERIFQLVIADLPSDFPALKTLDSRQNNLPTQPTPLIGRERESAAVVALLRRAEVRLVTLTGPGGIGKTRLGLQVAAELLDGFADGVWFVNLAPINDSSLVATTIAHTLGVAEVARIPIEKSLRAVLREKRTLLLLDNFEQVLDAAPLVAELLAAAPGLTVLVTSRAVLHLSGEHEFAVPPLALPDLAQSLSAEQLTQYEALKLFVARAQAAKADFAITKDNAPAVAEICHRLDGLPLAIELAAARVKLFPPQALLARLSNRLALLTSGPRDLPARQQTLRNAIAWSYNLLSVKEQILFRQLGVFVGGCTLEAAEAVCNVDNDLTLAVVDCIASLLDQSLLRREGGPDGEPRFVMLETIREYALERLKASGETEVLRRRHAECFLALAETAELWFHGPDQRVWLDRIEVEHVNLRAALAWSLEVQRAGTQSPDDHLQSAIGLRLAAALWWFWDRRGYLPEGRRWLERTLAADRGIATPGRVKALVGASALAGWVNNAELAQALGEEGLALARQQEDTHGIAWSLWALGLTATSQNDFARARPLFEESLVLFRALGDTFGQFMVLSCLGNMARRQGDYTEATTRHNASLALARAMGDRWCVANALSQLGSLTQALGDYAQAAALLAESLALHQKLGEKGQGISWVLFSLGNITRQQGDNTRAIAHFGECLARFRELGDTLGIAACLEGIAQVAIATAQHMPAVRLFGAAAAIRDALGLPPYPDEQHEYDRLLTAAREQLGDDAFAAAWAAGRAMTLLP